MVDTFVLEVSVVHNIDVQYRGILQTEGASISLHTAAAPAVRAAVKTSLPYRNDTIRNDTITQSLSYLTCWTSCDRVAMPDARDPFLAPNQKLGDKKMFHIFHFFKSDMAFTIIDPFLWKANVIFRKSCSITMPFLLTHIDVRTVKFFPPAESSLVNSNFPRGSRMQGCQLIGWSMAAILRRPVWWKHELIVHGPEPLKCTNLRDQLRVVRI